MATDSWLCPKVPAAQREQTALRIFVYFSWLVFFAVGFNQFLGWLHKQVGVDSRLWAHQAEARCQRAPPVVVAAAELEVEQQGAVGQKVEAVGVHQQLAAPCVS